MVRRRVCNWTGDHIKREGAGEGRSCSAIWHTLRHPTLKPFRAWLGKAFACSPIPSWIWILPSFFLNVHDIYLFFIYKNVRLDIRLELNKVPFSSAIGFTPESRHCFLKPIKHFQTPKECWMFPFVTLSWKDSSTLHICSPFRYGLWWFLTQKYTNMSSCSILQWTAPLISINASSCFALPILLGQFK